MAKDKNKNKNKDKDKKKKKFSCNSFLYNLMKESISNEDKKNKKETLTPSISTNKYTKNKHQDKIHKNFFDDSDDLDDVDKYSRKRNFAHNICRVLHRECHIFANIVEGNLYIYRQKLGYFVRWCKNDFPMWLYDTLKETHYEKILDDKIVREVYHKLLATSKQVSVEDFDNDERYVNVLNGTITAVS